MDRFLVREPRLNADHLAGNQMITMARATTGPNMSGTDGVYYRTGYGELPHLQVGARYIPSTMNVFTNQMHPAPMQTGKSQNISGIDPNYLAAYNQSAGYVATGQQPMQREMPQDFPANAFGTEYQNKTFLGAERHTVKQFVPQMPSRALGQPKDTSSFGQNNTNNNTRNLTSHQVNYKPEPKPQVTPPRSESSFLTNDTTNVTMSRAEKLKLLHKTGPRVFTGPVEKVLKWHKSLHDLGILIIYEIVGKCVSIRSGGPCAKHLVVRDDSGPAVQVVYYEVDFLLPELTPPCMVRVAGRMVPGSCRLQAFSVRGATGDDVVAAPRRAAVAQHHVAKLAKEYCADNK